MHAVQEPHLVNNGEDGLQGQGIRAIMGTWPGARVGLRRVESLATPGLYCMIVLLTRNLS